jgi:hypothetical protein
MPRYLQFYHGIHIECVWFMPEIYLNHLPLAVQSHHGPMCKVCQLQRLVCYAKVFSVERVKDLLLAQVDPAPNNIMC